MFKEKKWARISQLIAVKLCCLTRAATSDLLGADLKQLFQPFQHGFGTRGEGAQLQLPKVNKLGGTSFRFTGAYYYNKLPGPERKEDSQTYRRRLLKHVVEKKISERKLFE